MGTTKPLLLLGLSLALSWLTSAALPARAADINLRVSVKFILGPMGQMPCCGNGTFDSFEDITNQVNAANEMLLETGRGYRFQITEVTTVDGDASDFFNAPREDKEELEAAAEADPVTFKWRSNAINMYVNNFDGSARCSFPGDDDLIIFGQSSRTTSLFHESGHFFNLRHTHQGQEDCEDCACGGPVPGNDDDVPDTLPDHSCWDSRNEISQGNFGMNFNALSNAEQNQVENIHFNIMSYHDTRNRLTPDQMDRLTDAANGSRSHVTSGRTWFVDLNNDCDVPLGNSTCIDNFILSIGGPFPQISQGISASDPGDVVLIRQGTYQEAQVFSERAILRASRGDVIIR